jgi:hypothetical protein
MLALPVDLATATVPACCNRLALETNMRFAMLAESESELSFRADLALALVSAAASTAAHTSRLQSSQARAIVAELARLDGRIERASRHLDEVDEACTWFHEAKLDVYERSSFRLLALARRFAHHYTSTGTSAMTGPCAYFAAGISACPSTSICNVGTMARAQTDQKSKDRDTDARHLASLVRRARRAVRAYVDAVRARTTRAASHRSSSSSASSVSCLR